MSPRIKSLKSAPWAEVALAKLGGSRLSPLGAVPEPSGEASSPASGSPGSVVSETEMPPTLDEFRQMRWKLIEMGLRATKWEAVAVELAEAIRWFVNCPDTGCFGCREKGSESLARFDALHKGEQ